MKKIDELRQRVEALENQSICDRDGHLFVQGNGLYHGLIFCSRCGKQQPLAKTETNIGFGQGG